MIHSINQAKSMVTVIQLHLAFCIELDINHKIIAHCKVYIGKVGCIYTVCIEN